jgi:hypothetical protein
MYEATVSIDLGASYTKVAFRRTCEPSKIGSAKENAEILLVDGKPLIPSLAIQTKSKSKPWVFGWDAANLKPDASMKVFQNWKANLFRPQNDRESAAAVIVAEHFLGWLKEKLENAGVNLAKTQTRIAMPAFKSFDDKALVVALCMEMNGWESPWILKATEPHANTVGLFSRGKNVVGRNWGGGLLVNYGKMFGNENVWVQTARGHTLYGSRRNLMTAMVVDIGAFTTDLAAMTFDVATPDMSDGLQRIEEQSYALGIINDLDCSLFAALAEHHGFDWSEVSFQEAEMIKQSIYGEGTYALLTKGAGEIELGTGKDRSLVEHHLEKFASALWNKISSFVDREKPSVVYMTGGGARIMPIFKNLEKRLRQRKCGIGRVDEGGSPKGSARWRPWDETGEGLHRLATALGGASVVLQAGAVSVHSGGKKPAAREPLVIEQDPNFVHCRCQGGNKDCCFCGGRGFYAKR